MCNVASYLMDFTHAHTHSASQTFGFYSHFKSKLVLIRQRALRRHGQSGAVCVSAMRLQLPAAEKTTTNCRRCMGVNTTTTWQRAFVPVREEIWYAGSLWRPYRLMNSRLISVDRSSTRPDRSRLASFCRKVPSLSPAIYLTLHAAPPSLPPHQYITDIITQNTRIIRFVDAVVWSVRRDESTALYDWLDTVPKSTCHWLRGGDVTVE